MPDISELKRKNGMLYHNTVMACDAVLVNAITAAYTALRLVLRIKDDDSYESWSLDSIAVNLQDLVLDLLTCPAENRDTFSRGDDMFNILYDYGHMPETCLKKLKKTYGDWFYENQKENDHE